MRGLHFLLGVLAVLLCSFGVKAQGVGRCTAPAPMGDVQSAITEADNNLKVPHLGSAPLPRSVTGLQVSVGAKSLARPVTRVFLVGE